MSEEAFISKNLYDKLRNIITSSMRDDLIYPVHKLVYIVSSQIEIQKNSCKSLSSVINIYRHDLLNDYLVLINLLIVASSLPASAKSPGQDNSLFEDTSL